MESCIVKTPLGFAKLEGDQNGISSLNVLNNEITASDEIPEVLEDCVRQLGEYFKGERTQFSLKLNPQGTNFQNRVWDALLTIPVSYTHLTLPTSDLV